jgi:hypothetical protein
MSTIKSNKCDHCGRIVEDSAKVVGWVSIPDAPPSVRFVVRTSNGVSRTEGSDWCNIECLVNALTGVKATHER